MTNRKSAAFNRPMIHTQTVKEIDAAILDVKIKVPLNSDRPIKIENRRKSQLNEIPRKLKKEIETAFANKQKTTGP